ncbi:Uncharacterized protein AXF42_Ash015885 [Apostasia shenzhenica]|uniref:Glycosyltransferase n=1 Tax=Apostasia shenzhenica TaxID=1088818 RepID=A0A2H9ZXX8_9ASPA|nr:Uncharacterized protein AXF42_Ash015885 [Apostasia shenzhenica]
MAKLRPLIAPRSPLHRMQSQLFVAGAGDSPRSSRADVGVHRRFPASLFFLLVAGLSVIFIYRGASPTLPSPRYAMHLNRSRLSSIPADDILDAVDLDNEEMRLMLVLEEAAMDDNTVILTTLNAAWASAGSIIDLFLESFHIGYGTRVLLDHLVIIAFDKKAYLRCIDLHPHCFALRTEGVDFSGEKKFMSEGYLKMMWRRIDFLRVVLEKGFNFIFTDTDVMWFRNPLPHFFPDGDFQIACDQFIGNPLDRNNRPNGGFNFVKSNNRTIEFYKYWYESREKHPGYHDQDVLNIIKYDSFIDEMGLEMRFLSTAFFGGLCEPSRNLNVVCTMHANCCIGLSSKISDLKLMLEDWRRYMSLPPALKRSRLPLWRVPKNCSLASLHELISPHTTP